MWKLIKTLIGGSGESPIGSLALQIREAIKGQEIDPNTALEMIQKLNQAEAQHRSVFVAGWRPFIGWIGGLVLAFNYIVAPILIWVLPNSTPPVLDLDQLWPVITGMLGIAGMRSYDKSKNK